MFTSRWGGVQKGALLFRFQLFDGDGFFLWISVCNFLEDTMKGFNQV